MLEYRIHLVQAADWQLLRSTRLRALADAPDAFGTLLAEDEALSDAEWRSRVEDDAVAHYLAMNAEGECFGMAVGAPYTDYANTAGLFGMWVASEARGQKVGKALVEAVIAWARNCSYERIVLEVGDANLAAVRLYESCGFVPTGKTGALSPSRNHILEHERELALSRR